MLRIHLWPSIEKYVEIFALKNDIDIFVLDQGASA